MAGYWLCHYNSIIQVASASRQGARVDLLRGPRAQVVHAHLAVARARHRHAVVCASSDVRSFCTLHALEDRIKSGAWHSCRLAADWGDTPFTTCGMLRVSVPKACSNEGVQAQGTMQGAVYCVSAQEGPQHPCRA